MDTDGVTTELPINQQTEANLTQAVVQPTANDFNRWLVTSGVIGGVLVLSTFGIGVYMLFSNARTYIQENKAKSNQRKKMRSKQHRLTGLKRAFEYKEKINIPTDEPFKRPSIDNSFFQNRNQDEIESNEETENIVALGTFSTISQNITSDLGTEKIVSLDTISNVSQNTSSSLGTEKIEPLNAVSDISSDTTSSSSSTD